jgi:hypothetical protein
MTRKADPVHTMKAYRGTAPLILKLDARWRCGQYHNLTALPPSKNPDTHGDLPQWVAQPVWTIQRKKNLCPCQDSNPVIIQPVT